MDSSLTDGINGSENRFSVAVGSRRQHDNDDRREAQLDDDPRSADARSSRDYDRQDVNDGQKRSLRSFDAEEFDAVRRVERPIRCGKQHLRADDKAGREFSAGVWK